MSDIRVTYSGLIAFFTSIIGVVTGTIFVIIVTRQLSQNDFGLWILANSLVTYVLVVEPIISFWTIRQLSRGENVGKTAFLSSSVFSVGGILAYIAIAFFVHYDSGADLSFLLIATIIVPIFFLTNTLTSICHGFKPQAVSFSNILLEITKIPLGIFFVLFLEWGVYGALWTVVLSLGIKLAFLLFSSREKIKGEIKKTYIKYWAKNSWIPLYKSLSGLITKLDVLLYTTITGSLIGPAYWGVSIAASSIVSHSFNISHGLYPKLLAKNQKDVAEQNFHRTMLFAFPLFAATIVFAKPALHILNPVYTDGVLIVYFLSMRSFISVPLQIFYNILSAYEKIDTNKSANFLNLIRSKLFLIPTLQHIQSSSYIILLVIFFLLLNSDIPEVQLVSLWAFSQFITVIPFFIIAYNKVRSETNFKLNFKFLIKIGVTTTIASLVSFFISNLTLSYPESIYQHLPQLIPVVILGGSLYFGIMFLIDKSTRILFVSIINEFRN